eukprot:3368010-Alexandrium_andersonii.AAC.1
MKEEPAAPAEAAEGPEAAEAEAEAPPSTAAAEAPPAAAAGTPRLAELGSWASVAEEEEEMAVSYTHLTLPTICSV